MDAQPDPPRMPPILANAPFTPVAGATGSAVTVRGSHFDGPHLTVAFGDILADIQGQPTPTEVIVTVPAGLDSVEGTAWDVQITVATDHGRATSETSFRVEGDTPAPAFPPAPSAEFTPTSGVGGQTISLSLRNVDHGPQVVWFDTVPAPVVGTPTASTIVVTVPMGMIGAGDEKAVRISVTTPGGTAVSRDRFLVVGT